MTHCCPVILHAFKALAILHRKTALWTKNTVHYFGRNIPNLDNCLILTRTTLPLSSSLPFLIHRPTFRPLSLSPVFLPLFLFSFSLTPFLSFFSPSLPHYFRLPPFLSIFPSFSFSLPPSLCSSAPSLFFNPSTSPRFSSPCYIFYQSYSP